MEVRPKNLKNGTATPGDGTATGSGSGTGSSAGEWADVVTLVEAKAQTRVEISAEDTYIQTLITAARELCEAFTRRAFLTTHFLAYLDAFPKAADTIVLPRSPVASVDSIKYYDADNALQVLAASTYDVDTRSEPARITLAYGASWPSEYDRLNAVEIAFTAGYGAASDVPQAVKQAVLVTVADWYLNREGQGDLPPAAKRLLWLCRAEV